ncbi:MAG: alginate lyase family protein [Eubacteriales bacterium]|nr:alginate lyase family protein [Eubacteriales bacterium]
MKIKKYCETLKYLKKSQIRYLVKNRLTGKRPAKTEGEAPVIGELSLWTPRLDSHPDYLRRFSTDELLQGKVTLLYESGRPGGRNWEALDKSHLWNFNLHYLEFLIPLAAAWQETKDERYYDCFRDYCLRWIGDNREGTGDGWHPYTISLRLTNLWICMDGFGERIRRDEEFLRTLCGSMYAQYRHLEKRKELHLLGNHYLENLKALLLGALYFKEPGVYAETKSRLQEQLEEQILADGVHYERSLMYHKLVLEDLMRLAKAVRTADKAFYQELTSWIQAMTTPMYSLEEGMGHTPLFNDAGDNVARTMPSLLAALREEFGVAPLWKGSFPEAGYYCLRGRGLKLLMDAGEIAPSYMPGHGHCDGLSIEISCEGRPVFVNSGTGLYQGELRSYFRSTRAHNTVVIDGGEQSECWGEHRVAARISKVSGSGGADWMEGELTTCGGKRQRRRVEARDGIVRILDTVEGHAQAYFHLADGYGYEERDGGILVTERDGTAVCRILAPEGDRTAVHRDGELCLYAPEFGRIGKTQALEIVWEGDGTEHEIQIIWLQQISTEERKG